MIFIEGAAVAGNLAFLTGCCHDTEGGCMFMSPHAANFCLLFEKPVPVFQAGNRSFLYFRILSVKRVNYLGNIF
jgi:hypothetical protein